MSGSAESTTPTLAATATTVRVRLLTALLLTVLVVGASLPGRHVPLGFAGGSVDGDWFDLGANIATFGVFGFGPESLVYRSPGFPAYVALILKVVVDPDTHSDDMLNAIGPSAVLVGQALLLGLCAATFFLWLSRRLRVETAFLATLVFALNPYSLAITSLIHYEILHWLCLLLLLLSLDVAFGQVGRKQNLAFFLAGVVLTAGVLVRPVTLIAPAPLLLVFYLRKTLDHRWNAFLFFLAGIALSLAPWTARNFIVTGRFIPVHAQGWSVTMVSTSSALIRNPDVYEWNIVARHYYLPLYTRVTGESTIATGTYARRVLDLEAAAREDAFKNLREKPHLYLLNAFTGARALTTRINAGILSVWLRLQTREPFNVRWIAGGQRNNLIRGPEAHAFQFIHDLLLALSALGLLVGLFRRDAFLLVPVVIAAAIVASHALSYLDYYYYAVKIPFLVGFAFYGADALPRSARIAFMSSLVALSVGLSWLMGFFS